MIVDNKKMRLKFLFFPLTLIISVFLFIGYVWPEIMNLKVANEDKMKKNSDLAGIEEKKAAIGRINDQINGDSEGELLVKEYLPANRNEEKIMTGINFLATDSSVSLVNISLENKIDKEAVDAAAVLPDPNTGILPITARDGVQFTQATISLNGKYDRIRIFLNQLQEMAIFNSIESVSLTKEEVEKSGLEGEVVNSDVQADPNLTAKIVVDFGWMQTVAVNSKNIAGFKSGMDNDTVSVLRNYVSQKVPSADIFGNKNGKDNPFSK